MLFIIFALFLLTHLLISVYDFSFFRIPNVFLGALGLLYVLYAPIYLGLDTILGSLVIFASVLVVSFGLYALKIMGAGDAKYISIASLWFGVHGILPLLFLVSLMGGGLAIVYLIFRDPVARLSDWVWMKIQRAEEQHPRLRSVWIGSGVGAEEGKRENVGARMIPYGVAIAAGSIIMLGLSPITH